MLLESVLERIPQLSVDSPQGCDEVTDGVTDQLVAAIPAQPAAAAENDHVDQSTGDWAEVLMNQMAMATSVEDAQCRAARSSRPSKAAYSFAPHMC
jgi:hypothetical protein